MDYLDSRLKEHGSFSDDWTEMRDLYSRKLWHQLTLHILDSLKKPGFVSSVDLDQFNDNFLNSIKQKINPLSLAEIIVPISEGMVKTDPQKTIKFIEENRDKYMSMNDEAVILSNSTIGMIRLLIIGDMPGARDIIESTGEILSKIDGVTSVHSRFYRMSSNYYKLMGQHAEYYREALRFLGCTDMAELPVEEKQDWAFSVGLAALLGNGVYNFGELVSSYPLSRTL
ncbi:unnamed protein product [Dibothriocephalus latus]|uniref:PSD13 N-terminal domain-containing protein n=1 Tax=Dibothriocephalus latus TaxID=60516 RepID=A0A3P7LW47_DIBLA|nr:unnamed protein product [Dibothriocephalus latus]